MSDFLNPALDELRDVLVATWPELATGNGGWRFWRGEHVAVLPMGETIERHGLPYAVLIAESAPAGIDAADSYERVKVEVYYLVQNRGKPDALLAKGQVLRDALWPDDPLTLSQVETRPVVSTSLQNRGNAILRGKKEGLLSVSVSFTLLTGEPVEV